MKTQYIKIFNAKFINHRKDVDLLESVLFTRYYL